MIDNLELKLEGKLPVTRKELFTLISSWGRTLNMNIESENIEIKVCESNQKYPLENLDVSQITDLSLIFNYSPYNGDLSKWDVSNCSNMIYMFYGSKFNNDSLKNWNVSNVTNMDSMFWSTEFNGDLSNWDVSNVNFMMFMFYCSNFNNDSLNNWNLSSCKNIEYMFKGSKFNGNISKWDLSNVKDMTSAFADCPFDGDISNWKFNINISCEDIFYKNKNFEQKYNNNEEIKDITQDFLDWFEANRLNISNANVSKKDLIDIDDYLISFSLNEIK